ncbi:hypothetical protein L7F22_041270 [Adiantum nelumboides]|nr:hypothetical protein [Adiantum nelumboides]
MTEASQLKEQQLNDVCNALLISNQNVQKLQVQLDVATASLQYLERRINNQATLLKNIRDNPTVVSLQATDDVYKKLEKKNKELELEIKIEQSHAAALDWVVGAAIIEIARGSAGRGYREACQEKADEQDLCVEKGAAMALISMGGQQVCLPRDGLGSDMHAGIVTFQDEDYESDEEASSCSDGGETVDDELKSTESTSYLSSNGDDMEVMHEEASGLTVVEDIYDVYKDALELKSQQEGEQGLVSYEECMQPVTKKSENASVEEVMGFCDGGSVCEEVVQVVSFFDDGIDDNVFFDSLMSEAGDDAFFSSSLDTGMLENVTWMYDFQCLLKAAFVAHDDVIGVSKPLKYNIPYAGTNMVFCAEDYKERRFKMHMHAYGKAIDGFYGAAIIEIARGSAGRGYREARKEKADEQDMCVEKGAAMALISMGYQQLTTPRDYRLEKCLSKSQWLTQIASKGELGFLAWSMKLVGIVSKEVEEVDEEAAQGRGVLALRNCGLVEEFAREDI